MTPFLSIPGSVDDHLGNTVAAAVSVLLLLAIDPAIGILATMGADRCISTPLYIIEPNSAVGRYSCAGW